MEIALLSKSGLRIKGKHAVIAIDPQDKNTFDAVLAMSVAPSAITPSEEMLLITGPGEYEVGGIKMSGIRSELGMIFTLTVDGVDILIGQLGSLEKMQHKLREYNIAVVLCDGEGTASFVTALASNSIIFYGAKASEIAASFGKENIKQMTKYSTTKDKLPAEVETVVLA